MWLRPFSALHCSGQRVQTLAGKHPAEFKLIWNMMIRCPIWGTQRAQTLDSNIPDEYQPVSLAYLLITECKFMGNRLFTVDMFLNELF